MQSLPKQIPVNDIAAMNVTFVNSPVLSNSSVELEISGLFTGTSGTSLLNYYNEGSQSYASCDDPTTMIRIALHENVFISGALVYFNVSQFIVNLKSFHIIKHLYSTLKFGLEKKDYLIMCGGLCLMLATG